MDDMILTRNEVMERLKIGRNTFYKLLVEGKLKGFKEGNRYKIPVSSVKGSARVRHRHLCGSYGLRVSLL